MLENRGLGMIRDRFPPAPPARMLIFEESQPGRAASAQVPDDVAVPADLPNELLCDTRVTIDTLEASAGPSKARAA